MMSDQDKSTSERTERVRAKGKEVLREGRDAAAQAFDTASDAIEEHKSTFAGQIDDIATAARNAAGDLRNRDQQAVADWIERAADGIRHASVSLRENDLKAIYSEVENLARRQPAIFIGGTALLGFAMARFARSSAERRDDSLSGDTSMSAEQPTSSQPYQGGPTHG